MCTHTFIVIMRQLGLLELLLCGGPGFCHVRSGWAPDQLLLHSGGPVTDSRHHFA